MVYTASAEICFSGLLAKDAVERGLGTVFGIMLYMMVLCLSVKKVWVGQHKKDNSFFFCYVGSVVFLIKPVTDIKLKIISIIIADNI